MNKRQFELQEAIYAVKNREADFPVVDDLSKIPKNFRGVVLEINDHGNIALWRVFKNGKCREIASQV